MRDRYDLNRSGEYNDQETAYKRAKAYNARSEMQRNRDIKTTTQTPGSGGQTIGYKGTGIQQMRNREIGEENARSEANKPTINVDDDIYDIYKTD